MQVCTSLQTDNHASTPPLCFLQAGCPSCHPTNSIKALKVCYRESLVNDSFNRYKDDPGGDIMNNHEVSRVMC